MKEEQIMRQLIWPIMLSVALCGCHSVNVLRGTKHETGTSLTYSAGFEDTYKAAEKTVAAQGGKVVEGSPESGYLFAKMPWTWIGLGWTYGEWMAVYLEETENGHTRVKVVQKSRALLGAMEHDWQSEFISLLSAFLKQVN